MTELEALEAIKRDLDGYLLQLRTNTPVMTMGENIAELWGSAKLAKTGIERAIALYKSGALPPKETQTKNG